MSGTFKLGRIGGVPVGLHFSWLFFFLLITWSLAVGFPVTFPGVTGVTAWVAGAVAALLFLASVLGHELAHAWMALARGVPVRGITLFILGGSAEIERDADTPFDELLITAVGPLSSLGFGVGFGVVALIGQASPALHAVSATMALINISLALFNLLPGFPLDGGRILRAILWGAMGDFVQATRIAARMGQLLGWGMIAFGGAQALFWHQGIGGLWTAGIGWYLGGMAQTSYQQVALQYVLRGVAVSQVMRAYFAWVHTGTRVQDAVAQYFRQTPQPGLPVLRDGQLIGLVTLAQVRLLDTNRWAGTPVDAVMTPVERVPAVAPGDTAERLLNLMQQREVVEVAVVDAGRLVGLVTQADLLHFVQARRRRTPTPAVASPGIGQG